MNLKEKLTRPEKAVIHDSNHYVYFEIIKGMSLQEMQEFDVYLPNNFKHYMHTQSGWLLDEQHLIAKRTGHCTQPELLEDIEINHNSERYKVFYCLAFPNMVHRRDE